MNVLLLSIYRYFIMPLAVSFLPFAALFNSKLSTGLKLRRKKSDPLNSTEKPIWIHASSGEFEYAKSVIRELKAEHPEIPIVVTFFSPTFSKAAASFPGVDRAIALPLDLPGPCVSFLNKYKPRLGLIARTDLWPEMLEQCRKRQIPVVLFSYTQKQPRNWPKKMFTRWMLHWLRQVYCVSTSDLKNLQSVSAKIPAEVMGDTRYDQVSYRLNHPKALPLGVHPPGDIPCLIAGSTWSEDEAVLLPALADLLKQKKLLLVLVPHEPTPEHLKQIQNRLQQLGLQHSLYSKTDWTDQPVLLVDQVGVLAELYAFGDFAFIGGSFRKSVHSVMEALGAGCITFVGPFHENNREALEFKSLNLRHGFGLEVVTSSDQFRERITHHLEHAEMIPHQSEALRHEFDRRLGASRKLVEGLEPLL